MPVDVEVNTAALRNIATQLRIDCVKSTSEAGSGHPTTCASAAEIVATLFFAEMRFDPTNPQDDQNDRFVLSKGHAAPILYAAWAEAGLFPRAELLHLREIGSDLEGHPTPRLSFVDVATGSLGQGLAAGVGIALNARRIGSPARTYVLLGDGESAEGSVWEAAEMADYLALDNLCAIVDVNRLGQSRATQLGHDVEKIAGRWRAFGWHAIVVDGHDVDALLASYREARATTGRPTVIIAKTIKGKGIPIAEGKDGWHGKAFKKGEELDSVLAALESQMIEGAGERTPIRPPERRGSVPDLHPKAPGELPPPDYKVGQSVATREAYGTALAKLGALDDRIVALDADVGNSTFSERFEQKFPDRFYQAFIAEQAMIGAAMGLASRGAIPFPSTFACFLSRAYDFVRMTGISGLNVKMAGSHAGVSIGEDGPSQMALEDLAMMRAVPNCTVVYPCDAVSTERLLALIAYHDGPAYMRTSRPKTPVLYDASTPFRIGGCHVLRSSEADRVTIVAAGVTVFEALQAYETLKTKGIAARVIDLYSVQPIDTATLRQAAAETGTIITVEDHYPAGGLGEAVMNAVAPVGGKVRQLAVREIPRSGRPDELLDRYGISARHIVEAVQALL
ncbi:MAG TPA: transketolase [Vicinamibacterales bacterium]